MHPSANTIVFTWGKYKGLTLGYVLKHNPQYLHWMISADALPDVWKIAASKVIKGEDISTLKLPATKNSKTTFEETIPSSKVVQLLLVNKSTAAALMPYDRALIDLFKYEIDGRKWNYDEKRWEFPAVHLPKALEVFKNYDVKYDDNIKKLVNELNERRTDLDEIRQLDDIKIKIPGIKMDLYPYQSVGVKFIDRAGGRCLVADAPGLGKTVQALAYAQLHGLKTIIVCPLSVVLNWKKEVNKFFGKDATIWDSKGHVGKLSNQFHIAHYDAVAKVVAQLRKQEFDLLVCDEATYLKNRQTIRAKSILGSWRERRKYPGIKTKYCIFLTGTPVLSRPIEAFSLLNFLDKERFNNFYHFVERYGGWKGAAPMNLKDLHERTKDLVIRRKKEEVLTELPKKQRNELYVELHKDEQKEYRELLKEMFGHWRMEGRPSVQHVPKLQSYLTEKKLPRLIEMIDEFLDNDRPILIFSCYLKPLKQLLEHYKKQAVILTGEMNKKKRQESIDALVNGEAKIGLFSLRAAGMGIDGLQHVIDTVVFIDADWVPANHEQAEDRTHRIGQTKQVQVFYMVCEGTIDEYMIEILREKQEIASQIVDGESFQITSNKSFFKEFVVKINSIYKEKFNEELAEEVELV
jgi:SWI/SNF-related matrix-associated actin-dependent regulator 1 of chromatin subfamily A